MNDELEVVDLADESPPKQPAAPKYPDITVQLTGQDGNAFVVLGTISKAMRRGGVPSDKITEFQTEATSGDYNHLLQTAMKWVDVQ